MNNEVYNVNEVYIAAFDIGKLNFCFCVEKFNPCNLKPPLGCKLPPKKLRYIAKRPVTYGDITASLREIRPLVIIVPKRVKDIRENPYTGERLAQPPFCTIIAQVNTKIFDQ